MAGVSACFTQKENSNRRCSSFRRWAHRSEVEVLMLVRTVGCIAADECPRFVERCGRRAVSRRGVK